MIETRSLGEGFITVTGLIVKRSYAFTKIVETCSLGSGNITSQSNCLSGSVLILSNEDGLGDTIRPRLDGMKANVNRIHHLSMISFQLNPKTSSRAFSLKRDVLELEKHLKNHPDTKLIIIEPIHAYCDGTDT